MMQHLMSKLHCDVHCTKIVKLSYYNSVSHNNKNSRNWCNPFATPNKFQRNLQDFLEQGFFFEVLCLNDLWFHTPLIFDKFPFSWSSSYILMLINDEGL